MNNELDINDKKKIQENIYKCSQNELIKIIDLLLNFQNKEQEHIEYEKIKYTKNSRGFFFNMNTIPNKLLFEIKDMLDNFNKNRVQSIIDTD